MGNNYDRIVNKHATYWGENTTRLQAQTRRHHPEVECMGAGGERSAMAHNT